MGVADVDSRLPPGEHAAVVADFRAMRGLLGPRDFEGFYAGYTEYGAWRAARGSGGSQPPPAECRREERGERASHAS